MPNNSNILFVLALNVPRKVYDGSGYDAKCPAAELYLCPIPQGQFLFDLLFYIYGVILYPSQ